MKNNYISLGFGIVFGLGMLPLAYINLALGIALAFAGAGDFAIMVYVFAALGVLTIIASLFAKKCVWVTRIVNTLTLLTLIGTFIYLAVNGVIFSNMLLALAYVVVMLLGVVSVVFAWLSHSWRKQIVE